MSDDADLGASEANAISDSSPSDGLLIRWPALALALGAISLAAVSALVIVATIADADALATIALVLAILSFGSQLVITAAQAASANEQFRQFNRLYEDSRGVLHSIHVQSRALFANQSDQFNKILDHVLSPGAIESAVAAASGHDEEPSSRTSADEPAQADPGEVARLLRAAADRAIAEQRTSTPVPRSRGTRDELLRTFPPESEGREVAEAFSRLSDEAKTYIRTSAERYRKSGQSAGMGLTRMVPGSPSALAEHYRELENEGFVQLRALRGESAKTTTFVGFTDRGVTALRFFTARGLVPRYLREILEGDAQ